MKRAPFWMLVGLGWSCSSPSIRIEDLPTRASSTICGKYYECCMASELSSHETYGPDKAGCETKLKTLFDAQKNQAQASEMKMRAVYRGDKLSECLAAYQKLSCAELKKNTDSMITACDGVFEPKVGVGAACGSDLDCISGSCRGATLTSDGMCAAKAGQGASCADADCADGTYCQVSDDTCQNLKADGQGCYANFECATGGCNGRNPDGGMPNMGTCGEKGGPGTTCYATDGCSVAGGLPAIGLGLALAMALARRRKR